MVVMIGYLSGNIVEKSPPMLLLEVNGVGYELQAPMTTFYALPAVGEPAVLYTHFVVREDAHLLYAFSNSQDRLLFRTLIKVSGVGPKVALAILSGMEADAFVRCVQSEDAASLVRIPGVGKKMAERLIVELRSHLKDWVCMLAPSAAESVGTSAETPTHSVSNSQPSAIHTSVHEAVSALLALGYRSSEAHDVIDKVKTQASTTEELVRLALRYKSGITA